MKKLGIALFSIGVIVMIYTAVDFAIDQKKGSIEEVRGTNNSIPFPWLPSTGAVLIAFGIIMMSTSGKKKV
jgi:hypothetical protein